jgi:hypothetical protein
MADKPFYTNPPWTFKQERPEYIIDKLDFSKPTSLYLYNINTEEWVFIPVIPDSLSASYSANFQSVTTHGLIRPVRYYTGGSEKSVSFTIKMHEDLLHKDSLHEDPQYKYSNKLDEYANADSNLYALVDVIKRLSEPSTDYKKQVLLPPKVYFQLGNQFAGTGHIDTSVSFSVPFRNGRYIMADISFTFVFHEIFESNKLTVETTEPGELTVGIGIDDPPGINSDADFENFYKESVNVDFIIENSLKDSKIRRLLEGYTNLHEEYNPVSQLTADTLAEIINTANMAELKKQFEDLMFSIGVKVDHGDAALARYLEFFFESMIKFKIIMAGTYQVDNTLKNLGRLKREIQDTLSTYQSTYIITNYTEKEQEKIREVLSNFDTLVAIMDAQFELRYYIGSEK